MIIDKNYCGLKRLQNGDFFFDGAIKTEEDVIIRLNNKLNIGYDLMAGGKISSTVAVSVGGNIISENNININGETKATANIIAKRAIRIDNTLDVGGQIKAGRSITVDKDIVAGRSIETEYDIIAGNGIICNGIIKGNSIEAGWDIKTNHSVVADSIISGGSILSGGCINANWTIRANCDIQSQLGIKCRFLSVKNNIFAGLCAWKTPVGEELQIICSKLDSGTIKHGKLVIVKAESSSACMTLSEFNDLLVNNRKKGCNITIVFNDTNKPA